MNQFFSSMYKKRGKPHYPENIAKAEHERLLSSTLLVSSIQKNNNLPPKPDDKDHLILQKIKEEKKKLTKNYQLFLDTYHDHFSGKLKYSKTTRKKKNNVSTPGRGEKKFNIVVNPKPPVHRQPKNQNTFLPNNLTLDLQFVENETPPTELKTDTPSASSPLQQSKPGIHNFVMNELHKTNEEIDSFNVQLEAIQRILNDHKDEIKLNAESHVGNKHQSLQRNNNANSRPFVVSKNPFSRNSKFPRYTEFSKMHYKSISDALVPKKNNESLQLLYSNDMYNKKKRSYTKFNGSISNIDINSGKKGGTELIGNKSFRSSISIFDNYINQKSMTSKPKDLQNPETSVSAHLRKNNNRLLPNTLEKARSYPNDKSTKNDQKQTIKRIGRNSNRLSKNYKTKHNSSHPSPHVQNTFMNSIRENAEVTNTTDSGDNNKTMNKKKHYKSLGRKNKSTPTHISNYTSDSECFMNSYFNQRLSPTSPHISNTIENTRTVKNVETAKYLSTIENIKNVDTMKHTNNPNNLKNVEMIEKVVYANLPQLQQKNETILKSNFGIKDVPKIVQENIPQGIFGNKALPKGITNSLFLKSELNHNLNGSINDNRENDAKTIFLRKMNQAKHIMRQQNLIKPIQNVTNSLMNKKSDPKLYSSFYSALKDTLFEPHNA